MRHTTISAAVLLLFVINPGPAKASECSRFLDGIKEHGRETFVENMAVMFDNGIPEGAGGCNTVAAGAMIDLMVSACKSGADSPAQGDAGALWGVTCATAPALDLDPKQTYKELEKCIHGKSGDPEALLNQCATDLANKYADRLKKNP